MKRDVNVFFVSTDITKYYFFYDKGTEKWEI